MTTVGIVVFPGSNCEHDMAEAMSVVGADTRFIWHGDTSVGDVDAVVIPGGFAHGDYLRPGAIARFSPAMEAITAFANMGGSVVGICNGFQILTEAGLLPGALQKNARLKFRCGPGGSVVGICNGFQILTEAGLLPGALQKNARLKFRCGPADLIVKSTRSVLTRAAEVGQVLNVPINHFEGNYTCSPETLQELIEQDRIVLTYADNPNGSIADIAGISNEAGNVVGLMPHPERACNALLGSTDGLVLLSGLLGAARTTS